MTAMRALVTNDDGIDSAGLAALASVAVTAGLEVIVAAPETVHDGSSASLTALQSSGRLTIRQQPLAGLAETKALAVDASPALITIAAAQGAFGPPPNIVLSGINRGPNTGNAVLHSGTVGAALTARTQGISALAVSSVEVDPGHWDTCYEVAGRALTWLLDEIGSDPITLSVNVPDVPLHQLRGLRAAHLATSGTVQTEIGESSDDYVTITHRTIDTDAEPGTDAALLKDGWAPVTALAALCEATEVDLTELN